MISRKAAARYSKALFDIPTKELVQREKDLSSICEIMNKVPLFQTYLLSPQIPLNEKKRALHRILDQKVEPLIIDFICTLLDKGRWNDFSAIVYDFQQKTWDKLNILKAKLVTALPPTEKLKNEIHALLKKKSHKEVILQEELDPKIIGGAILYFGNHMIDFSIRDRLSQLKNKLLEINV